MANLVEDDFAIFVGFHTHRSFDFILFADSVIVFAAISSIDRCHYCFCTKESFLYLDIHFLK